jgi:hypothetical protein
MAELPTTYHTTPLSAPKVTVTIILYLLPGRIRTGATFAFGPAGLSLVSLVSLVGRPAPVRLLIRVDLFYLFLGIELDFPSPPSIYSYRIPSFVTCLFTRFSFCKPDRACCLRPLQLLISLLSSFVPESSCLATGPP